MEIKQEIKIISDQLNEIEEQMQVTASKEDYLDLKEEQDQLVEYLHQLEAEME